MAQELTKYRRLPSPLPGAESAFPPGKHSLFLPRMWCGMVPVLPALTRGTLPSIDVIGMTYRRGRLGSSSNNLRVSAFLHQSPAAASSSGQTYSSKVDIRAHFILYLTLASLRSSANNEREYKHTSTIPHIIRIRMECCSIFPLRAQEYCILVVVVSKLFVWE